MVVLDGVAVSYERGTPVLSRYRRGGKGLRGVLRFTVFSRQWRSFRRVQMLAELLEIVRPEMCLCGTIEQVIADRDLTASCILAKHSDSMQIATHLDHISHCQII